MSTVLVAIQSITMADHLNNKSYRALSARITHGLPRQAMI